MLGKILRSLALQQNIIDVLLLHSDFEALVLLLEPLADVGQELGNGGLFIRVLIVRLLSKSGHVLFFFTLLRCMQNAFLRQDLQAIELSLLHGSLQGHANTVALHLHHFAAATGVHLAILKGV